MKTESTSLRYIRSLAAGLLLSMLFFYGMHVFGTWKIENYRPDPDTTSTVLLHNTCAILGKTHTLRPNTDVSGLSDGVNGTTLSGSFMNFFDGHIAGIIIVSLLTGSMIFLIRNAGKRKTAHI